MRSLAVALRLQLPVERTQFRLEVTSERRRLALVLGRHTIAAQIGRTTAGRLRRTARLNGHVAHDFLFEEAIEGNREGIA